MAAVKPVPARSGTPHAAADPALFHAADEAVAVGGPDARDAVAAATARRLKLACFKQAFNG